MSSLVDFTDTNAFFDAAKPAPNFNVPDPTNSETKISLTTVNLKKSNLYRAGTKIMEDKREGGLGFPLFFSDKYSISPYANSGRAVRKYKTTNRLRLMEFTMENLIKLVDLSVKRGKIAIESFLVKTKPEITEYDAIFPTQPDNNYETNNPGVSKEFKYMNRTIAQCVCEIGLDGWIAMPGNNVKQQVIDREMLEMLKKIKTALQAEQDKEEKQQDASKIEKLQSMIQMLMSIQKFNYVEYAPEILVCNPNTNIIMVEETASTASSKTKTKKGGKRIRRKTRNNRK